MINLIPKNSVNFLINAKCIALEIRSLICVHLLATEYIGQNFECR